MRPASKPPAMASPVADPNSKTLYMGDLAYWMDENYLYSLFAHTGDVTSVRLIRNKATGASEGYGFIDFLTREAAERVLRSFNGQPIPNTEHLFRLNWASVAGSKGPPSEGVFLFFQDAFFGFTKIVYRLLSGVSHISRFSSS